MSNVEDAMTTCALRFDGYTFMEETGFDHRAALDTFYQTGEWNHLTLPQQMSAYFLLQRYLNKWGGEMLPHESKERGAYHSLFLVVCREAPPEQSKTDFDTQPYLSEWERRFVPQLDAIEAAIRREHEATVYETE